MGLQSVESIMYDIHQSELRSERHIPKKAQELKIDKNVNII